jgi:hypothetical protein
MVHGKSFGIEWKVEEDKGYREDFQSTWMEENGAKWQRDEGRRMEKAQDGG